MRVKTLFSLFALWLMLAAPSAAQSAPRDPLAVDAVAKLTKSSQTEMRVHWKEGDSHPRRVSGLLWQHPGETPEQTARQFIEANPRLLAVPVDALKFEDTEQTRTRTAVTFSHTVDGLQVLDSEVKVLLDSAMNVVAVISSLRPVTGRVTNPVDIGWDAAFSAAFAHLYPGLNLDENHPTAHRRLLTRKFIYATHGGVHTVYRVAMPGLVPTEKTECLVDSATGKILRTRKLVVR